jgi:uncharacterized delta-60 repeat protein
MTLSWLRSRANVPSHRRSERTLRTRLRVEALEDRTLLAAQPLDPSFGVGGLVVSTFSPSSEAASRVAVQPDGKIVVAGGTAVNSPTVNTALTLGRYNPDGSLDATFGQNGVVTLASSMFAPGLFQSPTGLVLQGDGKIVVSGTDTARSAISASILLRRFNADGSPDASFNGNLSFGTSSELAGGLALQPDGKLIVAATVAASTQDQKIAVARLDADGQPDPTFGVNGKVVTTVAGFVAGVAVQPDGRIVVGGSVIGTGTLPDYAVLRLLANGTPDVTFGTAGVVTTDFAGGFDNPTGILLQPDGKILLTGSSRTATVPAELALLRYTTTGTLDATFGNGGKVSSTTVATGRAALQVDGKIVVAGTVTRPDRSEFNETFGVARFNPDGSPDITFGNGGVVTTLVPERLFHQQSQAMDVVVQADGKIVATGSAFGEPSVQDNDPSDSVVARYLAVDTRPLSQRFVASLYQDLLQRPAEAGGLTFWSGLLDQGASRFDVARAIQNSPEYREVLVRDAYRRLLLRLPDASGQATWTQFLAQGGTEEQLKASLLGSEEYFTRFGLSNNDVFLEALYHNTLNRSVDDSGKATWGAVLASGAPRAAVALALLRSREADMLVVQGLYQRLLGRPADDSGLNAFTDALQRGIPDDVAAAVLAASQEYFDRAQ